MLLVLITLLFAVIGVAYIWLRQHYLYWAVRNVLHEKPVYFLGNMRGIGTLYHWGDINKRIYKRFKGKAPLVGFYTFMTKAAFIMDLDLIKHILIKDFATFPNRGLFHNVADDPLTGNLLFLDGEPWRVLRHKLSTVFTTGKIRSMLPTMVNVAEQLVAACNKIVDEEQGKIEAKNLCALYTTDLIGTCAFGIECNSLSNPNAEFRRMGRSIFESPRHNSLVMAFMFTDPEMARRLRMKHFSDDVSEFFLKVVRETVEYRQQHGIKRNDFMDLLIELKAKRDQVVDGSVADEYNLANGLTIEQIAAQAMMFFLAGFDTSSTTMSFCIYELAQNQQIQMKLRQEIQQVLAKSEKKLTYEAIKEMTYLDQVISETLRKYSVLPHIARRTISDYRVPNTDYILEANMRIILPVDCIHHDPAYYPDPEIFDPERFTPEAIAKRHPFAYLPFGDGPRNCIGMRFGKLQAQIGLATLLPHFKFTTNDNTQIPVKLCKNNFLVAAESGLHLDIEKI